MRKKPDALPDPSDFGDENSLFAGSTLSGTEGNYTSQIVPSRFGHEQRRVPPVHVPALSLAISSRTN
ncbi:MAG: hypothetical protein WA611_03895, partial [Candidatus Acidiferrales bacterium]